jgi:hypothetical protein
MDSSIGDPLFNDPQNDDYRLKGQSPAFKLGFVPIDLGKIGPRNQWGMAISATSIRKQE